jgi:short-subunit dehydrogenase
MTDALKGKTALITGASSGMGADFARRLAALGCDLILTARRMDRMQKLQAEISALHRVSVDCRALDLLEADAPRLLHEQLAASGRRVDVLVNNAGRGLYGLFCERPWDDIRRMLELDVVALTQMTRLFAPDMVARQWGRILLVASTAAFQPTPTYAAYAGAKSYVLSLGEALHFELKGTGVSCTVLCPGATRTEFFDVAGQSLTLYQKMTMMDSAKAARIGIKAMLHGRSCVVAGRLNSAFALGTRLMPRRALAAAADRLMH